MSRLFKPSFLALQFHSFIAGVFFLWGIQTLIHNPNSEHWFEDFVVALFSILYSRRMADDLEFKLTFKRQLNGNIEDRPEQS